MSIEGGPGPHLSVFLIEEPIEKALPQLLREGSAAAVFKHTDAHGERRLSALKVRLLRAGAAHADADAAVVLSNVRTSDETSSGAQGRSMMHELQRSRGDEIVSPDDPHEERLEFARRTARGAQPDPAETENLQTLFEDPDPTVRGLVGLRRWAGSAERRLAKRSLRPYPIVTGACASAPRGPWVRPGADRRWNR